MSALMLCYTFNMQTFDMRDTQSHAYIVRSLEVSLDFTAFFQKRKFDSHFVIDDI